MNSVTSLPYYYTVHPVQREFYVKKCEGSIQYQNAREIIKNIEYVLGSTEGYITRCDLYRKHPNPWPEKNIRIALRDYAYAIAQEAFKLLQSSYSLTRWFFSDEEDKQEIINSCDRILWLADLPLPRLGRAKKIGWLGQDFAVDEFCINYDCFLEVLVNQGILDVKWIRLDKNRHILIFDSVRNIQTLSLSIQSLLSSRLKNYFVRVIGLNDHRALVQGALLVNFNPVGYSLLEIALETEQFSMAELILKYTTKPIDQQQLQKLMDIALYNEKISDHLMMKILGLARFEGVISKRLQDETSKPQPNPCAIRRLCRAGAQVEFKVPPDTETTLDKVISSNKIALAKQLITSEVDTDIINELGETRLYRFCRQEEIVDFLLTLGANVNKATPSGETVLMKLVSCHPTEKVLAIAKKILEAGADLHLVNAAGENTLQKAINARNQKMIDLILDMKTEKIK
jgi:ankyrin repeat protein